jgi:hypothetical protein
VEELRMHLAWRWFTGLGFENPVSFSRRADLVQTGCVEEIFNDSSSRA